MIRAVAKFRFLRTDHLLALASGSEQNLKRRLQKLFHAGYLDRAVDLEEARRYRTLHLGTAKAIYALGNRGVRHLETSFDYPPTKSRWDLLNRRASSQNIQHTLLVSEFCVRLFCTIRDRPNLSLRQVAETVRNLFSPDQLYEDPFPWCYMGLNLKSSLAITAAKKGQPTKAVFYPDGFFVIQDGSNDAPKRSFYFLEADNGTFTRLRLRQKFLGHAAMRREVAQGNNPLKIPSSFQILHVSKTEKRTENVWKLSQQMKAEGLIPPDLHWFTSEERYIPDALFAAIWRTPANNQLHSIVKQ